MAAKAAAAQGASHATRESLLPASIPLRDNRELFVSEMTETLWSRVGRSHWHWATLAVPHSLTEGSALRNPANQMVSLVGSNLCE